MHHAPAVHFAVGSSRWFPRFVGSLWLLGCGAMTAFFATQVVSLLVGLIWGAMVLIGAGVALGARRAMPCGDLRWDGAAWHWSGFVGASPCLLVLHMDLQHCLLVTVHRLGERRIWLWLEPQRNRPEWLALRRAVVGAQRAATLHGNAGATDAADASQGRA